MNDSKVTKRMATHVAAIRDLPLDEELKIQVKKVLMDYLCAAIAGSGTEVSQLVYQYMLESEGEGKSPIIGHKIGLSKTAAAFVNGTSAHSLDMDDGHTAGSIHPGTVVFPAVLAAAEKVSPDFDLFAKSVIAGYETCLRLSAGMHPSSRKRGFHNTPVAGIFGATAAVSVLYGLEREEIRNAFGISASFAGGLFAFLGTGSEVKRIHPGQAARDALMAVELTQKGLTGPKSVFEGENGVFQGFAGKDVSVDRLFVQIGEQYEIMNVYFKPYPCCRHLHSSIDAIYKLKEQIELNTNEISKIRIGVNQIAYMHRHTECQTILDAQMSLPYSVASAVVHPVLKMNHFDPNQVDERVRSLIGHIEVYIDKEADQAYPAERASNVEIIFRNGENLSWRVANPLGEPSNPLTYQQLEQKFLANCAPFIGEDRCKELLVSLDNIEKNMNFLYQI